MSASAPEPDSVPLPAAWQPALTHSRFLRQLLAARPAVADWLAANAGAPLSAAAMQAFLAAGDAADETALKALLRGLRQRTMAALIVRDLAGEAPLAEVVETMTALADVTTNFALDHLHRQFAAQYGEPLDADGRPQRLLVVGMGKLGGRELNVSSDVDYIFVYPEEGQTAGDAGGRGRIDNYDFFTRLGKRLIAALGEITADGQVFRVDMRLRPNGDSGPLVCSLDSLENYFITQGREWERYAWIKARVMNDGDNLQPGWKTALEKVARPFVFRKYLDFGAINAMRDLHAQIRREVARKDMADHIKLGPGGIREIEFIAQVFQLIRGGRDSALQLRPTLQVLKLLAERRLLPEEARAELAAAYDFLRRLEHRLQYVDDAQTHMLPTAADARAQIAASLGFADWPALLATLDGHRAHVARHFEQVFSDPEAGTHPLAGLWLGQCGAEDCGEQLGELGFADPQAILDALERFRGTARYQQLPASNRERIDAVGPRLIQAAAATPKPDLTFARALAFLETISRRGAYLALLQQYPQALAKVAELVGSASWAAEYLNKHPVLLDEVLDPRLYDVATDWPAFREILDNQLAEHAGDAEREMDILREAHHAQVFRVLAQDLAGLQTLERISDHLSELADIIVQKTLQLTWPKIRQRHCETPKFAVIGYGKLGGKELGYASDLDMVFLYDDDHPDAQENYARLAQRVNTWLSSQTSAGMLFETDLRLRPNGDAGLIAISVDAFRDYQLKQAWVWEHQALTRARFVAGDAAVGARFEAIREEILTLQRDPAKLREEVLAMRRRMLDAHASNSEDFFDLKQDPGGIIDVEFIVQYLILAHAHAHPELTQNLGNIALLGIAAGLGLIPAELAEPVRNAYREYRRMQHAARLNGSGKARIERAAVQRRIEAVRALWQAVFAEG
ncbi:bifunctional [glutamate--ammonia ligase]-adenylyl-L-tyrosine phosphorylase/[glutamate--ammonia-ligase] adenylyltransferase [Azospira restricta]|uniref:Bifunctional glutamine synthetase adenylyltransferase/adenylyl-removing enzyme n=1 Tax=Azospira restricta TaxID=404405 RepID=A0A974SRQ8_9RHOO|nr:bifunctional [glutamate--ammonia ligase]-adenylyl-L-tyrosine phosphorylase/[glutamate--ammonia-ligase] adenylyltransferase [Azospira restricta]QRJ65247.1 bifunctional [glutamate--ammonia ligase]-adenylyl-L-tyrosine phosphorylase/[glutamate--ammonia-ligase] adenylyltransferase [Azospira restricta]